MKPVVIAGILAVLVVLVASPVIAQEEITESLQDILDGIHAEITALTQAAEQRDQQLENMTDDIETVTNALEGLDARLSSLELTCPDGQTVVNGICQNTVCPIGYSLSGNECVEDVESVTEPLYKEPIEIEVIDIELIDPEPVTDLETCKTGQVTEYHDNGNRKSETSCRSDGTIEEQILYHENGNKKSWTVYYPDYSTMSLYDENGVIRSTTGYHPDGSIKYQTLHDENGIRKSNVQNQPSQDSDAIIPLLLKIETLYGVHGNWEYHVETSFNGTKVMITYDDSGDSGVNSSSGGIKTSYTLYYADGSIQNQSLWNANNNYNMESNTWYYPDGSIENQDLKNENGNSESYTVYYPDGSIEHQSLYHDDGYRIYAIGYYSTGIKEYEELYDDDKIKSKTYYNHDGTVEKEYTYEYLYYDNGNLKSDTEYLNGSINLQYLYDENGYSESLTVYYPDGSIEGQNLYENGTIKSRTSYYPDGSIEDQFLYDENGRVESWFEYYPDGSIESQKLYDEGTHMCTIENDPDGTETNREYFNGYTEC